MDDNGGADQRSAADDAEETPKQRADRELGELLEEIRVALPGVELLFGFLLILPFSDRFEALGTMQRGVYLTCFVLTAAAIALFIAPAADHRLGFRIIDKELLVIRTSRQVIGGLAMVALAVTLAGFLVGSVVMQDHWAGVLAGGVAAWFVTWWFVLPRVRHARHARSTSALRDEICAGEASPRRPAKRPPRVAAERS